MDKFSTMQCTPWTLFLTLLEPCSNTNAILRCASRSRDLRNSLFQKKKNNNNKYFRIRETASASDASHNSKARYTNSDASAEPEPPTSMAKYLAEIGQKHEKIYGRPLGRIQSTTAEIPQNRGVAVTANE